MRAADTITLPSGEQHEIRHGTHRAIATEVGATLRHHSVEDVDIVDGFESEERSTAGRGQVLALWPNRLDASQAVRRFQVPVSHGVHGRQHGICRPPATRGGD